MLGLLSPKWHAAYPFKEFWRRSPGWSERLDLGDDQAEPWQRDRRATAATAAAMAPMLPVL